MADSMVSRFIRGTLATGFGKIAIVGLGLLGLMITTRVLPADELGAFMLLQVIIRFLANVSGLGFQLTVPKFIAGTEDPVAQRRLVNTVIYFRVFTIALTIAVAMLSAQPLFNFFDAAVYDIAVYLPGLLFLDSFGKLLHSILQGTLRFKSIGAVNTLSSVGYFILLLLLVVLLRQGVRGLIYARLISRTLSYSYGYLAAKIEFRLEFDLALLKEMLIFGFPLYINYILTFIFTKIDTFIIGGFFGSAEVAFYETARRLPDSFEQLYDAFREVYYPFMARLFAAGAHAKLTAMLNYSTRWISFFSIFGALGTFLFGKELIVLLFSDKYLPSVPVFILLMIGLNASLLDYTLGYSLVAIGESNKPPAINVLRTGVNFAGYLVFIPLFGVAGAALAGLVGSFAANPLNVYFLRRRAVAVDMMGYVKPILIFSAYLCIAIVLGINSIFGGVLIIALFLVTCILLSVVTIEDIVTIANEVRKILSNYLGKAPTGPTEA